MAPATAESEVQTAPIDLGDIAESEDQRNTRIAAELFPEDEAEPVEAEPAAEPTETASEKAARVRDEKGRFAPKGEAKDEPVAQKEAQKEAPKDASTTATNEAPKAPEVAPEAPKEPEPEIEPLQWLAYGQEVNIPGAQYKPGHGVFIPDASVPALRQAWARGQVRYPTIVQENAELRDALAKGYTRKEAEANAVIEVLGQYFASEGAFGQFLEAASQAPGLALREIRAMLKEKQLELGAQVSEPNERLLNPPVDEAEVAEALTDELEQQFRSSEFAGRFTPKQQRELANRVFQRAPAYLTRADADYPQHGIRKGDTVVNIHALVADLRYEVTRNGTAPKPAAAAAPSTPTSSPSAAPPAPPPSAVGRSRSNAAPKPQADRNKAKIPTSSLADAARALFEDDDD